MILVHLKTRPSALGMSDPICGPLIHNFVDEIYEDKVDNENSVYFKNFENGVGKYLEKENIYVSVEEMEKYQSIKVQQFSPYTVILSVGKRRAFRETWLA